MADFRSSAVMVPGRQLPVQSTIVAPWADLPKALQGGYKSLSNCDYTVKEPYDGSAPKLSSKDLKERWLGELRRRKAAEDEKSFAKKRAESRMLDDLVERRVATVDTVTVFDHRGQYTRSVSAPLEEFDARLDKMSEMQDYRRSLISVSPPRTFTPSADISDAMGAITFWYPADKQRLKFRVMEEARLAAAREALVGSGWTSKCPPGGLPKKLGSLGKLRVTVEEERRIQEYLDQQAKETAAAAEDEVQEENVDDPALPQADQPHDVEDDVVRKSTSYLDAKTLAVLTQRTESCQPPQMYRSELPATSLPKKLELPRTSIFKHVAPAPPWGRQTEEEERWKKRAQQALETLQQKEDDYRSRGKPSTPGSTAVASGSRIARPVLRSDVDRELKVVRDGGLLKRPKQSAFKGISSETLAFVKTLPRDFGRKGNVAMVPVPMPGAASLK